MAGFGWSQLHILLRNVEATRAESLRGFSRRQPTGAAVGNVRFR